MFWRQTAWWDHRYELSVINQGRDDASTVGNVVAAKWLQEVVQAGRSMALAGQNTLYENLGDRRRNT
jgi:hypothetical protein